MPFRDLLELKNKENRIYLLLVIWLLIGYGLMQFLPLIGVFVMLPLLSFMFFLYIIVLIWKTDLKKYSLKKILLIFIVSLPLILLLSFVFVVLFIYAILVYIFFTSWLILYGCYVTGLKIDRKLYKLPLQSVTRSSIYLGGFILSVIFLLGFSVFVIILSIYRHGIPILIDIVFIIVSIVIIAFFIVSSGYLFKKIYFGWMGVFFLLVVFYAFFLVLKVVLGLASSGEESSPLVKIGLVFVDIVVLLYSISLIMSKQAKLISEKFKFITPERALIFLLFAKACYTFAENFPYKYLKSINFPNIKYLILIGDQLSLIKNIAVLALFVILLIVIGSFEVRKHIQIQKGIRKEANLDAKKLMSMDQDIYKRMPKEPTSEPTEPTSEPKEKTSDTEELEKKDS